MTQIKMNGALPSGPIPDKLARAMWENLGGHYMAVVELRVAQRTEPDPDDDTEPAAQLRVDRLEIAQSEVIDESLRGVLRALWQARTAEGTLDAGTFDPHATTDIPADPLTALLSYVNERGQVGGLPAVAEWAQLGDVVLITVRRTAAAEKAA
jgi:hypothetical protein